MSWFGRLLDAVFGRPSTPPAQPTDPPVGKEVVVDVSVWGSDGQILPDASLELHPYEYPDQWFPSEKVGMRRRVRLPAGTTLGWGARIRASAEGYAPETFDVELHTSLDVEVDRVVTSLPHLVVNGEFFYQEDGTPITMIEATDFKLYKKFLDGEDIIPVLEQRQDAGFNLVRVLGMARYMWDFNPGAYGDRYYTELPQFIRLCARFGLYVEFVVFADTKLLIPDPTSQVLHWNRIKIELISTGTTSLLVELVNEHNQHENAVADPNAFAPMGDGILCAHGSNGSGQEPVRPAWDYETFHWNDLPEWPRKTAHNGMEDGFWQTGRPALNNENTRFPDKASTLQSAMDAAEGAALMSAGSCFHSVSGKNSDLWSGVELDCAYAWAEGARLVPLSERTKPYINVSSQFPTALRAYRRGDYTAVIDKV